MSPTILVVDDDPEIVHILQLNLEDQGYKVLTGYDGQMALNLAKNKHPQLIIMDVQMPVTNGLKAFEFLRKTPETKDIPVMFLSGAPSEVVYKAMDGNDRVAFIKKPLEFTTINPLVRQLLEQFPLAS